MTILTGLCPKTREGIALHLAEGRIAQKTSCVLPQAAPLLTRGLVDLQVNGYGGVDFNAPDLTPEAVLDLCRALAQLGVTRFLPTIITGSPAHMSKAIAAVCAARTQDWLSTEMICGLHIEGPFISPLDGPRGAHPPAAVRRADLAEFDHWQAISGGLIKIITLAPETEGALEFITAVSAQGVTVSLGHSAASAQDIAAAVEAGARMSTHLGNGAAGQMPRHPNLLWAQLAEDRLAAGFIADTHHLSPETFRAMLRAKGKERAFLVSDTVALAGCPPGLYRQAIGDAVELTAEGKITLSGTPYLAGAALPLLQGIERAAKMAGLALHDALDLASTKPAAQIGLQGLELGAPADVVLLEAPSTGLRILETWIAGRRVL